jgi:hypothetical protein
MSELAVIAALHKHVGQLVTPQVARAVLADLYPERAIDPAQFPAQAYDGVLFQAESLRAILPELHEQHLAHWAETERYRAGSAMNPDYEHMRAAERDGRLLQCTVRQDGALVGNLRAYLYRDLHTQQLGATEDTLFLSPPARRGFIAGHLIRYVEGVPCAPGRGGRLCRRQDPARRAGQGGARRGRAAAPRWLGARRQPIPQEIEQGVGPCARPHPIPASPKKRRCKTCN